MKYQSVKDFFNKHQARTAICLCAAITTMLGTTGCSFDFFKKEPPVESSVSAPVTVNVAEERVMQGSGGETIDESVQAFVETIAEYSTESINSAESVDAVREFATELAEENGLEFQEAQLVRVVDGDTIVVDINNEEYKVRLIGVNTPESVAPDSYRVENSEEGVLASDYTKDLLKDVTTVYLDKDTSDTDKYGRLLRYVWLEIPEDKYNVNEVMSKMLNGILVLDNVAEVATYEPDTAYADAFEYISEL